MEYLRPNVVGEGTYILFDQFIAFRDNHDNGWILNQVEDLTENGMKLVRVGRYANIREINNEVAKLTK